MAEEAKSPAAIAAAKILEARRVPPGQSGAEARPGETPEELHARLSKVVDKFDEKRSREEAKKAKNRIYARRHYRKRAGIPEKAPVRDQVPHRKRPALEDAILALEQERDEIIQVIEILRRYVG